MMLALTQEKVLDIQNKYMQLIASPKATFMELTKLLGEHLFTAQAVLPRGNSVQILATTANSGSERNEFLSNQNKLKPTVTGGVEVVEGEFTSSERQTTENRNATVNNPNGCFQNRLGQFCEGTTTGELARIWEGQNKSIYWSSLQ